MNAEYFYSSTSRSQLMRGSGSYFPYSLFLKAVSGPTEPIHALLQKSPKMIHLGYFPVFPFCQLQRHSPSGITQAWKANVQDLCRHLVDLAEDHILVVFLRSHKRGKFAP